MNKPNMSRKITLTLTRKELELLSLAMAESLRANLMLSKDRATCQKADEKLMAALNTPELN